MDIFTVTAPAGKVREGRGKEGASRGQRLKATLATASVRRQDEWLKHIIQNAAVHPFRGGGGAGESSPSSATQSGRGGTGPRKAPCPQKETTSA